MAKTRNQIVAGALYAFAGFLTSRKGTLQVGETHNAAPMAEAVDAFCKEHGLYDGPAKMNDPAVREWASLLKLMPAVVNDAIDPEYAKRILAEPVNASGVIIPDVYPTRPTPEERLYGGAAGGGKSLLRFSAYGTKSIGDIANELRKQEWVDYFPFATNYASALTTEHEAIIMTNDGAAHRLHVGERFTIKTPREDDEPLTEEFWFVSPGNLQRRVTLGIHHWIFMLNDSSNYIGRIMGRYLAQLAKAQHRAMKCDGDHGMPVCLDPECWQR